MTEEEEKEVVNNEIELNKAEEKAILDKIGKMTLSEIKELNIDPKEMFEDC